MKHLLAVDITAFSNEDVAAKGEEKGRFDVGTFSELPHKLLGHRETSKPECIECTTIWNGVIVEVFEAFSNGEFMGKHFRRVRCFET
jgi:hypothetical protein